MLRRGCQIASAVDGRIFTIYPFRVKCPWNFSAACLPPFLIPSDLAVTFCCGCGFGCGFGCGCAAHVGGTPRNHVTGLRNISRTARKQASRTARPERGKCRIFRVFGTRLSPVLRRSSGSGSAWMGLGLAGLNLQAQFRRGGRSSLIHVDNRFDRANPVQTSAYRLSRKTPSLALHRTCNRCGTLVWTPRPMWLPGGAGSDRWCGDVKRYRPATARLHLRKL